MRAVNARFDLAPDYRRAGLPVESCAGDRSQREQILALARLSIALLSFAALPLDTSLGPSYGTTRLILLFYLLYSLLILMPIVRPQLLGAGGVQKLPDRLLFLTRAFPGRPLSGSSVFLIHSTDVMWAALVCLLTGSSKSPFLFLFVFAITAAAYRWSVRGMLSTAGASVLTVAIGARLVNAVAIERSHLSAGPLGSGAWLTPAAILVIFAGVLSFLARRQWLRAGGAANSTFEEPVEAGVHQELIAAERRRIARDLHDGVIQSLIALEIDLELQRRQFAGTGSDAAKALKSVQDRVRKEIRNLREEIEKLRLDSLPHQLHYSLAEIVEKFRSETGIAASFACDVPEGFVSARVANEVAHIVQEALCNVKKHSGARKVEVRLASERDTLQVVIRDDGRGFDFAGRLSLGELRESQRGPRVIRERVRSLNGDLFVESHPGRGALLEIRIASLG